MSWQSAPVRKSIVLPKSSWVAHCWYCRNAIARPLPGGRRSLRFCSASCRTAWRRERAGVDVACSVRIGRMRCTERASAHLLVPRPSGMMLRHPVCDTCRLAVWAVLSRTSPTVGWEPIRHVARWPRGVCACCGHQREGTRWRRPGWAACPPCHERGCVPTAGLRRCGYGGPPPAVPLPGWQ